MDKEALLKQLHDLHLPQAISWWPLAWGWYALLGLLLLLVTASLFYYYYREKNLRLYRKTIARVNALRELNSPHAGAELSELLKRIALVRYPRVEIAALHGKAWLVFLDKTGNTNQFTQGPAQQLMTHAYSEKPLTDIDAVINASLQWIETTFSDKKLKPLKKSTSKTKR